MTKEIYKARINPNKRLQPNRLNYFKNEKIMLAACWLLQYEEFKNNHFITTSCLYQQGRLKGTNSSERSLFQAFA